MRARTSALGNPQYHTYISCASTQLSPSSDCHPCFPRQPRALPAAANTTRTKALLPFATRHTTPHLVVYEEVCRPNHFALKAASFASPSAAQARHNIPFYHSD